MTSLALPARGTAVLALALLVPCGFAQSRPASDGELPALVDRLCGSCHRGPDAEEGFAIDELFRVARAASRPASHPERVTTVLQRVRSRTMPPEDELQPTDGERLELGALFEALLPADPEARIATVRRLTRTEYENTVRDLTGVTFDARSLLPEDARAHGFDNVGDVMSFSPLLLEKYLAAAETVARAMLADPKARAQLFHAERPLAATLPAFLERAFRRPIAAGEVAARQQLVTELVRSGSSREVAERALLHSILASPEFLFRAESGQPAARERLAPYELAVRLSYLITSTMPDDELFAAARRGELVRGEVLEREARRLLAKVGGRPLADGFAAQAWRFRDVLTASADFRAYPQIWNQRLRPAFYEEAATFFAALVREDASILALLDADHTYLDETLSKHYGIGNVKGARFERVALPDRRRGGVLGMGATLMVSSYPLRTSPVLRGRFVLDQMLDAPTPPPPPNVGTLAEPGKPGAAATLRESLEAHRKDRACAACHAQIDPLGFALENFDVLGRWRTEDHGKPIDTRAKLPDGTELDGPIALKDALLARKPEFTRAVAKKLLVYAIGRNLVGADEPEVGRIVAATVAGEYRFSALLVALVRSPLFTMRDPGGPR